MADFIKDTLTKIEGVDPRIGQRSTTFSGMNEGELCSITDKRVLNLTMLYGHPGPAAVAARIAGLVQTKDQVDDCPY